MYSPTVHGVATVCFLQKPPHTRSDGAPVARSSDGAVPFPELRATAPSRAVYLASPAIVAAGSRAARPLPRSTAPPNPPPALHFPPPKSLPRSGPSSSPSSPSRRGSSSSPSRDAPSSPARRGLLVSPSVVRRDVHARRSAEEEQLTGLGCGGGRSRPNPRPRRWWDGGGGDPVRSWWWRWFSRSCSSRRRAPAAAPWSWTRWRVSSCTVLLPGDGTFLHGRRWLPQQLVGDHGIRLPTSTIF